MICAAKVDDLISRIDPHIMPIRVGERELWFMQSDILLYLLEKFEDVDKMLVVAIEVRIVQHGVVHNMRCANEQVESSRYFCWNAK